MANKITIPLLLCPSIDEMLAFYGVLGFEVTYRQSRPNTYAVVRRGGVELHFLVMRGLDPAQSYSSCFIVVPDADKLYQAFADGLRRHYGRVPSAGIPRVTPLRNKAGGVRGFNVIDPGGNWIRIGQKIEAPEAEGEAAPQKATSTRLERAIGAADLLADSKGDYVTAAKVLNAALAEDEAAPTVHRVQAFVARAALAVTIGDGELAGKILSEVRQIPLHDDERAALLDELQRVDDLDHMLQKG